MLDLREAALPRHGGGLLALVPGRRDLPLDLTSLFGGLPCVVGLLGVAVLVGLDGDEALLALGADAVVDVILVFEILVQLGPVVV